MSPKHRSRGGVPDRWLNYTAVGERVEGTRFIAFKVPLSKDKNPKIKKDQYFDETNVLKCMPNLGLIIDLTNTDNYYTPVYFQSNGVEHRKLKIPGQIVPSKGLVQEFKFVVKNFLQKNRDNDKLIGVHCTHGVNRTGYFICSFMISEMTIDPKEAIKRFDLARGHKIERRNYISSLHNLLNENKDNNTARPGSPMRRIPTTDRYSYSRYNNYNNNNNSSNYRQGYRSHNYNNNSSFSRSFSNNTRQHISQQKHDHFNRGNYNNYRNNSYQSNYTQRNRFGPLSDDYRPREHNNNFRYKKDIAGDNRSRRAPYTPTRRPVRRSSGSRSSSREASHS